MEIPELITPSANNGSSSATSFAMKTFANPVSIKLNEDNFLTWRQQALHSIKGHKLQKHLLKSKVSQKYNSEQDEAQDVESQEYSDWEQQDHHLVSWLLASMDSSFANRMVGCEFAYEVWERIENYFAFQMRAKVRQLKTQLKASKKQGPICDYLLQIKKIVDTLAVVGSPISTEEHIEVILDGLNEDYSAFITIIMSRIQPFSIPELETLLMAQ